MYCFFNKLRTIIHTEKKAWDIFRAENKAEEKKKDENSVLSTA